MKQTKVVILTDIHYSTQEAPSIKTRRGDLSDILLLRAIHRINRFIKPDLVLCLGDFVNDALPEDTIIIREILNKLQCPKMVIPGNHDCPAKKFHQLMPKQKDYLDINGIRFIAFDDEERPGYNAERSTADITRLIQMGEEFNGPVISCQHVPLFQPGTLDSPYNYLNAAEITSAMLKAGAIMAISGHYHPGFINSTQPFGTSIAAPCLCESPFRFWELDITDKGIATHKEHQLRLPDNLELQDWHIHSKFAYCNENMSFSKSLALAEALNLQKLSFSEHSAHLYYSFEEYCQLIPFSRTSDPATHANSKSSRLEQFLSEAGKFRSDICRIGFEVDCDFRGRAIIAPSDLDRADIVLGAIHRFPDGIDTQAKAIECFKFLMERFVEFPMHTLAHPFRIFSRMSLKKPDKLYEFTANLLKEKGIAAELNFHTNEPPEDFFRLCLEKGVKITFGSDAHNLYEVGEFYPHLEFMKKLGCNDISDCMAEIEKHPFSSRK